MCFDAERITDDMGSIKTARLLLPAVWLLFAIGGCAPQPPAPGVHAPLPPAATEASAAFVPDGTADDAPQPGEGVFSHTWVAYWDMAAVGPEMETLDQGLESVSFFSILFGADDSVKIPGQTWEAIDAAGGWYADSKETYLTFVNDIAYDDGTYSLKDADLLRRLFADAQSMESHIDEIVSLTWEAGCDGIEIDYEAIKRDGGLWQSYAVFLTALYERATQEGLALRVVLETSALGKAQFPAGPDYVVMCYNLYGPHSGPGPKADTQFIKRIAADSAALAGGASFAFASGGFDWSGTGDVNALSEPAAAELAEVMGARVTRDEQSGALFFTYTDGSGEGHTVWFADGRTLGRWIDAASAAGVSRFSLWRVGNNAGASLELLAAREG